MDASTHTCGHDCAAADPVPTFLVRTLGCKVNQYDSQALREALADAGLRRAAEGGRVDYAIVNTCTVTNASGRKSRLLLRTLKRTYPEATVIATGCYARSDLQRLSAMPEVDYVADSRQDVVARVAPTSVASSAYTVSCLQDRNRAFLKVQDGCDAFCSYCIVPFVRGNPRSRPLNDALDELRVLIDNGYREIVIVGIHLGLYGRDLPSKPDLAQLVERAVGVPGLGRIRLSSIEAPEATDRLLAVVRAAPEKVCPHFHLPLQSGDDATLARMNRTYTRADFLKKVDKIRALFDEPALTTDAIVGFPGEDRAAFDNTLDLAQRVGFARMHVFPFSPRPGTSAYRLSPRVPEREITARKKELAELADHLARQYCERLVGIEEEALIDETGPPCRGLARRYVRVTTTEGSYQAGQACPIRISQATSDGVLAAPLEKAAISTSTRLG